MIRKLLPLGLIAALLLVACGGMMKIRDGNTAFELRKYALAIELLSDEYESARFRDVKAEKAFLLGESHNRKGNFREASRWYEEAANLGYGVDAIEAFAGTLMKMEEYETAADVYSRLLRDYGSLDEWEDARRIAREAGEWIARGEELPYKIDQPDFNSVFSDYAPFFYDSTTIVFSSDRKPFNRDAETYSWTGRNFFNYFTYNIEKDEFTDDFEFLNSSYNEGSITFSKDRKQVFFTRCAPQNDSDGYCRLWFSEKLNGQWAEPEILPFQEKEGNYAHPAVNDDGTELIYSFRSKENSEGYDMYVVYRRGQHWLEPIKLPGAVNTTGNELFPFLIKDTLYFSSDGHPGFGGLDIFRSVRQADGNWGQVFNLMPPFNSGGDDFGFVLDETLKQTETLLSRGYFTSNREQRGDQIFYFEQFEKIKEEEDPVLYTLRVEGVVYERLYEDPNDPNSRRLGRRNLPNAMVEIIGPEGTDTIRTRRDSRFEKEIEYGQEYRLAASAPDYLRKSIRLDLSDIEKDPNRPDRVVSVEIILDRKFIDREVIMEDIYYDFDEWFIREDAKPTLQSLSVLMEDNPGIKIELASHTDCRGSVEYNLELSQNRAQAAVDFLVDLGVDPDRLVATGYGKSRLLIDCPCDECTEEEHQMNRRTTFRILE
ncbi:MAG: flagellar motor protein MotB [Saprospirales bacterium]|nr:MAG: flagellar motor protein MotB [Saprospirales bacterium]